MLSRRRFGACAICAAIGLAGFKAEAQTQGAQSGGITRTHMGMVRSRQSVSDGHDDNLHGQCGSKV